MKIFMVIYCCDFHEFHDGHENFCLKILMTERAAESTGFDTENEKKQ